MSDIKEKLPAIKRITYILIALAAVEFVMLMVMIPGRNMYHWITVSVLAVCFAYLVRIIFALAKELGGK